MRKMALEFGKWVTTIHRGLRRLEIPTWEVGPSIWSRLGWRENIHIEGVEELRMESGKSSIFS